MQDKQPKPTGMQEGFNLSGRIDDALANTHPLELPVIAEAARRLGLEYATDAKTGLLNKDAFLVSLTKASEQLSTRDVAFVTFGDLDGFKGVNDALGHDKGDELLVIVSDVIGSLFRRDTDVVARGNRNDPREENIARLGGDEFAFFSITKADEDNSEKRETDAENEAKDQKERINKSLEDRLRGTVFERFRVSFSLGSVRLEPGENPEIALAKADLTMLTNKAQGKIDALTEDQKAFLRYAIPILEPMKTRIEPWLKEAAFGKVA